MAIRVLGCSGGLDSAGGSTCIQVSENILIDAGTGLSSLSIDEMRKIEHIFLTHSHMDHIAAVPMFLSNMFEKVEHQVKVYAQAHTIEKLNTHIFNNEIWPDFRELPTPQNPIVKFIEIAPGDSFQLRSLMPLGTVAGMVTLFPVDHTVPTVGVSVRDENGHFVFTSDTTAGDLLNRELDKLGEIDVLMIECSFTDDKYELAVQTKHMTPQMVDDTISNLKHVPKEVWINHLKPSCAAELRPQLSSKYRVL
ncbi:MAG: 3',5'-cyclic-nucleotide phosphodiesterase [Gammaproteobacteria bacterium]|nr:3',5'-cyclic-nucleotide phosphodiesterase [Gammaproteobacteria bacterium]